MKQKKLTVLFISLLFLGSILTAAQVTVIKAGRMIDPESAEAKEKVIIIINRHTIKEIGTDLKIPDNAKIIDLSKYTVLPGLFDGLFGHPDGVLAPALITRGLSQNLFVFGVRCHAAFYACHFMLLPP